MVKFFKYTVLAISIFAMTLTTLNITSFVPIEGLLSAEAAVTEMPESMANAIVVITSVVGDGMKITNNEPKKLKPDESLVILSAKQGKFKRVYRFLTLSSDQMQLLYPVLALPETPLLMNSNSSGGGMAVGLTIDVNCSMSYPPLKIKCTIIINL
jgi:hypothetical protein